MARKTNYKCSRKPYSTNILALMLASAGLFIVGCQAVRSDDAEKTRSAGSDQDTLAVTVTASSQIQNETGRVQDPALGISYVVPPGFQPFFGPTKWKNAVLGKNAVEFTRTGQAPDSPGDDLLIERYDSSGRQDQVILEAVTNDSAVESVESWLKPDELRKKVTDSWDGPNSPGASCYVEFNTQDSVSAEFLAIIGRRNARWGVMGQGDNRQHLDVNAASSLAKSIRDLTNE